MEPTTIGASLLGLTVAAAALVGLPLVWTAGLGHADGWLGLGLLGNVLLVAAAAGLAIGGLDEPRGSSAELVAFALAVAGASLHLLYLGFAYRETGEGSSSLPSWGPWIPLMVPLGFLVYAGQHWPASTLPAGASPIEWAGGRGYDAVEDATGTLAMACLALTVLGVTLVLLARSLGSDGKGRASRLLGQAWGPVLAWALLLGLVFAGLALQEPPAHAGFAFAQELLLHSPLPYALLTLGPLRWGLDRVSLTRSPRGGASPRSNRS